MASYFDPSSGADRALVKDEVTSRDDFADLADLAEYEVIEHFRRRKRTRTGTHSDLRGPIKTGKENLLRGIGPDVHTTDTTAVYLDYYKPDADNVESTTDGDNFKKAMKRAIARMIEYIAARRDGERGVKSRSRGQRSVTYSDRADESLPRNVTRHLAPYDARPRPMVL